MKLQTILQFVQLFTNHFPSSLLLMKDENFLFKKKKQVFKEELPQA